MSVRNVTGRGEDKMATKTEWFLTVGVELLKGVPEGTYFNTTPNGLEFQAPDLEHVRGITSAYPGTIWKKSWRRDLNWWEYATEYHGATLRIYAVREKPATCTAVFETRVVEEQVPVTYETREVTKKVLVGWDCIERVE